MNQQFAMELELFNTVEETTQRAKDLETQGTVVAVYTWQSIGRQNWLSRGFHNSDVLAYVLMPDYVDLPEDDPDDNA